MVQLALRWLCDVKFGTNPDVKNREKISGVVAEKGIKGLN
jgi:hypothetical protein